MSVMVGFEMVLEALKEEIEDWANRWRALAVAARMLWGLASTHGL